MNDLNRDEIKDVLFDNAFEYQDRLKEDKYLDEKSKIASDIYFYNKDILEIIEEASKHLDEKELEIILDQARLKFNFYKLII